MDYDALEKEARRDAKAFRENAVYDSEGDPVRLTVTADRIDRYADAIATLRARNEALVEALKHYACPKKCAWEHSRKGDTCLVSHDATCGYTARAALAANREG